MCNEVVEHDDTWSTPGATQEEYFMVPARCAFWLEKQWIASV